MTTEQLRLPGLRVQRPLGLPGGMFAIAIGVAAAVAFGAVAALHPHWWRGLLTVAVTVNLIVVGMKWPRGAAVATLLWLPFVAFIRRLIIADAGWVQNDPLLLVGPIVALFLCYRIFVVQKRPFPSDRLSRLVMLLLVLELFGVVNPFGAGGLLGGMAGLIYLGVPLLWFLIGREIGNRRAVTWLMYAVVIISVPIACYGLYQTELGSLPQWDVDWYQVAGFNGVRAGRSATGEILYRPWGTFASTSEYSGYLAFGVVFAVAMLYHRRPALAITLPLLGAAVFLAGGRSVMALTLLTVVVLTALRTRNRVLALFVVVLGIGLTYGAATAFGPRLDRHAGLSSNPKVSRQVGGLLNPLDPNKSTFLTHWASLDKAVGKGFTNPVGAGTGASNIGSRVGGEEGVETDIDIGDAFLSLGFVGGLVFLAIIILSFKTVFGRYIRGKPDRLVLAVAGILVVNFGQWLQGGHYAISALMWFLLGWAVRPVPVSPRADERKEDREGQPAWSRFAGWRRGDRRRGSSSGREGRRRRSGSSSALPSSPR